jgi:hypothetical protein
MGAVYRKSVTKPLPVNSEIITRKGEKIARWRDRKGKTRTTILTDAGDRIRIESATFYAKFRDGDGIVVEVPTGCRTEDAARQVLADLERKAERVRAGLITPAEARATEHLATPIAKHFDAYLHSLEAAGSVSMHRHNVLAYLKTLATECGFRRLGDLKREALERWLVSEARRGRSARSRNAHQIALAAFCNWAVQTGRLMTNPFNPDFRGMEETHGRTVVPDQG